MKTHESICLVHAHIVTGKHTDDNGRLEACELKPTKISSIKISLAPAFC